MKFNYDVIIVGSGSAGLTASIGLTKVGKKVLLLEQSDIGGECTNSGCIPSKTLIHLARKYYEAKKISGATKELENFKKGVLGKVQKKISEIRKEDEIALNNSGTKIVRGTAQFIDRHTIQANKKKFTARKIVIATGSSPAVITIKGLKKEKILTNEQLFKLKKIPESLLIYGGGPIACEMAQAFVHLGTNVGIVIRGEHLLSRDEVEAIEEVEKKFKRLGIKIFNHSKIAVCKNNIAIIKSKKSDKKIEINFDYLLMGLGRHPNLSELNLEKAKIQYSTKGIIVDKHYRTNQKNVFAVGDVSSPAKFTHAADDQSRYIVKKIVLPWLKSEIKQIPRVTYLDEEVAAVGLTWRECLEQNGEKKIVKLSIPWSTSDRAKTDEEKYGIAMVFAKRISGKILGASLTGKQAGEIINYFTLAIESNLSLWKVNKTIFPYPVHSLLIKKLSDQFIAFTVANLKSDLINITKRSVLKIIAVITVIVLLAYYVF